MKNNTGLVLEIQRMSTEDGPGLRTTVFFKGCSLSCSWCHNPESISSHPQVHWIESRCIGCKTCLETCTKAAVSMSDQGIRIDRSTCDGCGACAQTCPATAMELLGRRWSLPDLVHEVLKDRVYFEKSGGGITVSGGEPTLQSDFVSAFLKEIRAQGIQTALDTCGLCTSKALDMLLPYTSLVLFDIKEIDSDRHRVYTGSDNRIILDNLIHISRYIDSHLYPAGLWIRTPLVPGTTDTIENIRGIGSWLNRHLPDRVKRWELCSFNNLCRDKYTRLDMTWSFQAEDLLDPAHIQELVAVAKKTGINPDVVHWSGNARLDNKREARSDK
jgi:pyruvate formate lyase activating enzyme